MGWLRCEERLPIIEVIDLISNTWFDVFRPRTMGISKKWKKLMVFENIILYKEPEFMQLPISTMSRMGCDGNTHYPFSLNISMKIWTDWQAYVHTSSRTSRSPFPPKHTLSIGLSCFCIRLVFLRAGQLFDRVRGGPLVRDRTWTA